MSGGTGPRSTGYHHGRHGRSFVVGMPYPTYAPLCDPMLDPYCDPNYGQDIDEDDEEAEGDAQLMLTAPYYALEFLPDSDPYWDSLMGADPERVFNHIGNAAGIAALGRAALVLGGVGALGYGAYRFMHRDKGLVKP